MSWHFSRALVAEYLEASSLGGGRFAPSKSIPSAPDDSCSDKMKDTCHRSPFGMMFVPSTDTHGTALLTWFRAVFRARISQSAEMVTGSQEKNQGCGGKWQGSFARFNQNTYSWKTPQYSLLGGLIEYSETWPRWGMMQDGACFRLASLVHHTHGKGCSLWPTPTARDRRTLAGGRDRKRAKKSGKSLCHTIGELLGFPKRTYIKPCILEKMMIWPEGWTDVKPLETDKFRQWQQQHLNC